jgi:hypothetical protein
MIAVPAGVRVWLASVRRDNQGENSATIRMRKRRMGWGEGRA